MYTLVILTLLSAGALALPAPTNSTLFARSSHPNVGSYEDPDCKVLQGKKKDVTFEKCVPFFPTTRWVGINWGANGFDAAPGLNVFSDTECVNYATKTIKAPNAYSYIGKGGANTCIVWENLSGTWGSVRQAET